MLIEQTAHSTLAELSRCEDRSWLSEGEQNGDHKADKEDSAITEKVDRALWKDGLLRSRDNEQIDVEVRNRIVFLSGHVISATNQQRAEDVARLVPGVLAVKSYLVPDDKIIRQVAEALGKIERAYRVKFFTGAINGIVSISGKVGNTAVRNLAEKYAANIPGVRGVINSVRSPEHDMETEDQRFLQPVIGQQIYFRDGLLGKVRRVIINPNNRRVVSMIVQRQFMSQKSELGSLMGENTLMPEGLVIIPMNIIRYLTKSSGFLHIHSAETSTYSDFDPAMFVAPEKAWKPPYPYCPDDVLFPIGTIEGEYQTESGMAIYPAKFPSIQPVN